MFLSNISIKRPVLATVMSLVLIIFGIVGYSRLSVRELPDVDFPIVSVTTRLSGADPEIIEEEITDVIEEEVNTVEGVKHITSVSSEGTSAITVEFELDRNIDIAAQDIRDKVSRIRQDLPDDIDEPQIEKLDLDAQAIMWLAVRSKVLSQSDLTYFADKFVKERLQKVRGVGSIIIGGEKRFAVRIWLDADKLTARKLSVSDVIAALREKNVNLPSGRIEGTDREFIVKTEGELETVESFNDLIISYEKETGYPIRLSDIGMAKEGVENERTLVRFNSQNGVGLGILKQTDANTVEVAERVKVLLEKLKKDLPEGVELWVAFDSSEFVKQSIEEVKETLVIAGILVLLVIFLFLRNFRSTLIPGIAMPISIISTFSVMYFIGFTLNNFTLLAMVLAIGVVVDDAIVMLENIFRHMEEGTARVEAALKGSQEVAMPIISASLALMAVFLPVAFIKGQIGRFFFEFGISVAVAVGVSAFVALTLTPMMCSKFLKVSKRHSKIYNTLEDFYKRLEDGYKRILAKAIKHSKLMILLALGTLVISGFLFTGLGKEFVPSDDRGNFMIILKGPEGSTLEYTDKYLKEIEEIVSKNDEIYSYFAALALARAGASNVNNGLLFIRMQPREDRRHQKEIIGDLRKELFQVTGVNAFALEMNPLRQGQRSKTFEYILQHPDLNTLQEYTQKFEDQLKQTEGFIEVDTDLELNKPEVRINIDRDRAATLGVSIRDIADTLNTLLGGNDFTKFKKRGERYDVILQLLREDRMTKDVIEQIYIRSSNGQLVNLSNVVILEEGIGPSVINRYERVRSVKVSANLKDITLGEAIQKSDNMAKDMLPVGFTTSLTGEAEEMKESFSSLLLTFGLAIILIYLILAAQFESFIHSFTVMGALPLSAIGALGSLYLFGMTLNIYSMIGMIMLMGLVTKNSILLVDYTNSLRNKGMSREEAVQEAGRVRLRPILMTAVSTICGILPIALGLGAGAESRRPMGMAVVGGMATSTILTLFIVPILYIIIDKITQRVSS
jgi:multidrug efflux pump